MNELTAIAKPKVGFNIFGTTEFCDGVLAAIEDKSIVLKQIPGPNGYEYVDVHGQNAGRAWIDNDTDEALVCLVQGSNPNEDMMFPWAYRYPMIFEFKYAEGIDREGLPAFVTFVKFMEKMIGDLVYLYTLRVPDVKHKLDLPQGLNGLLEYEFFKQLSPTLKKIEFGVAFVQGTLGVYAYVMALVTDTECEVPLRLCSPVKIQSTSF